MAQRDDIIRKMAIAIAKWECPDAEETWDDPNAPVAQHKADCIAIAEHNFQTLIPTCPPMPPPPPG